MSEGPIHHWWISHKPPVVSTNAKTSVHLFSAAQRGRAYCGHRNATLTQKPAEVTCSACIAAATADAEAEQRR